MIMWGEDIRNSEDKFNVQPQLQTVLLLFIDELREIPI